MATSKDLTLIGVWPIPFVLRARIALNIKNLDYFFHEEVFGTKSELLLKSNPVHKKIPVLIHNDKPICESLIIVQYIDEVWASSGNSILPSDPYDRALARFWSAYVDEKFFPTLKSIASAKEEEAKKAIIEEVISGIIILEEAFTATSKGKDFFGGDTIGLLDIAFGSLLGWIRVIELMNGVKLIDPDRTPKLAQWAEKFVSVPAVASVFPPTEKLAEFAKVLFAKLQGAE